MSATTDSVKAVDAETSTANTLRGKISSDLDAMQKLHEIVQWTPGRESIRPDEHTRQMKAEYLDTVDTTYDTIADQVLHSVFTMAPEVNGATGKYTIVGKGILPPARRFERNTFAYSGLAEGTRHFIMWYTVGPPALTDEKITSDIGQDIKVRIGHDRFEFVWYENPKMTVPGLYHVQVFWRKAKR
jgi:hypothetical protein